MSGLTIRTSISAAASIGALALLGAADAAHADGHTTCDPLRAAWDSALASGDLGRIASLRGSIQGNYAGACPDLTHYTTAYRPPATNAVPPAPDPFGKAGRPTHPFLPPRVKAAVAAPHSEQDRELAKWGLNASEWNSETAPQILERAKFTTRGREIRTAAENGEPVAMTMVGLSHQYAIGASFDGPQILRWLKASSDAKETLGQQMYGLILAEGLYGVKKQEESALPLFKNASAKGNADSEFWIGYFYIEGKGGLPKNEAAGVQHIRRAAELGSRWAEMVYAGYCLQGSYGVPKNPTEALKWYMRSAEHGEPISMRQIAYIDEVGAEGLPKSPKDSRKWYLAAADAGDLSAQMTVAWDLTKGLDGFAVDDAESVKWFRKAAEQGDSNAMVHVAFAYQTGRGGTPHDDKLAVQFLQRSADAGNANGMNNLGDMYDQGLVETGKDEVKALDLYQQSAKKGFSPAMWRIGQYYETGRGNLKKDDAVALGWYRKALAAPDKEAAAQSSIDQLLKRRPDLATH